MLQQKMHVYSSRLFCCCSKTAGNVSQNCSYRVKNSNKNLRSLARSVWLRIWDRSCGFRFLFSTCNGDDEDDQNHENDDDNDHDEVLWFFRLWCVGFLAILSCRFKSRNEILCVSNVELGHEHWGCFRDRLLVQEFDFNIGCHNCYELPSIVIFDSNQVRFDSTICAEDIILWNLFRVLTNVPSVQTDSIVSENSSWNIQLSSYFEVLLSHPIAYVVVSSARDVGNEFVDSSLKVDTSHEVRSPSTGCVEVSKWYAWECLSQVHVERNDSIKEG